MADTQKFMDAVRNGEVAAVKALLQDEPALAAGRDENGLSAVLNARYRGRAEVLEALLAADPELTLWEAAAVGRVDRVRELLRRDPSLAHSYSPDGFAMLHAAYFAPPEVIELLLAGGADPNAVSKNAMALRPLHSAASTGNPRNVELLLKAGADANARQHGAWTALHAAAQSGNLAVAQLLLEHGAESDPANDAGQTAIGLAREKGHTAVVELLEKASQKKSSQRAG